MFVNMNINLNIYIYKLNIYLYINLIQYIFTLETSTITFLGQRTYLLPWAPHLPHRSRNLEEFLGRPCQMVVFWNGGISLWMVFIIENRINGWSGGAPILGTPPNENGTGEISNKTTRENVTLEFLPKQASTPFNMLAFHNHSTYRKVCLKTKTSDFTC